MPFCYKCGKNTGSNAFCGGCGTQVVKSDPFVKKVSCNNKGCQMDDIGYAPTVHGAGCPMNPRYTGRSDYGYP